MAESEVYLAGQPPNESIGVLNIGGLSGGFTIGGVNQVAVAIELAADVFDGP